MAKKAANTQRKHKEYSDKGGSIEQAKRLDAAEKERNSIVKKNKELEKSLQLQLKLKIEELEIQKRISDAAGDATEEYNESQRKIKELSNELEKLNKDIESGKESVKKANNEYQKQRRLLKESIESTEQLESGLASIGRNIGKNNDLYKASNRIVEDVKFDMSTMLVATKKTVSNNKKLRNQTIDIAEGYKQINYQIITGLDSVASGLTSNLQIEESLDAQIQKYDSLISALNRRGKEQKELGNLYKEQKATLEATAKSAKKAAKQIKQMHLGASAISNTTAGGAINKALAFSKNYLGGKFGSIEDIAKDRAQKRAASALNSGKDIPKAGTKGNPVIGADGKKLYGGAAEKALKAGTGKAAITASSAGGGAGAMGSLLRVAGPLAAAAGVLYMAADALNNGAFIKYTMMADIATGATPEQIRKNAEFQVKQTKEYRELIVEYNYILPRRLQIEYQKEVSQYVTNLKKDEYEFERSLIKDNVNFEVQKMKEVFTANLNQRKEAASLGISMSDRGFTISAKNLETMGISLTEMVDLSAKMAGKFGITTKEADKIAQSASVIKNRLGLGAEDVVDLTSAFRIMSGESAEEAIKYIYGLEKFAHDAKVNVRALAKDMAEAGKEQFKYANFTLEAFAKQSAVLNKIGTTMVNMQKATDTMVGGYKESIKAEMSLSAMIGKRVNLSGVRSALLAGQMDVAGERLRAQLQGMDVQNMNYFQRQQLSQATGLDMNSIMDLVTNRKIGTTDAELKKRDAMETGKNIAAGMRAIELENRAKELKFEQAERYAMLMMEQSFRLQMIRQEFNLRMELEKAATEAERQNITLKYEKEARAAQVLQYSQYNNAQALENYRAELINKKLSETEINKALAAKSIELKGLSENFARNIENIKPEMWPAMVTKMIELGTQGKLFDDKKAIILPDSSKYFNEVYDTGLNAAGIPKVSNQKSVKQSPQELALLGLRRFIELNDKEIGDVSLNAKKREQLKKERDMIKERLMAYDPNLINDFYTKNTLGFADHVGAIFSGEDYEANKYLEAVNAQINALHESDEKNKNTTNKQVEAVNKNTKATVEKNKNDQENRKAEIESNKKSKLAEVKPDIEGTAKWTLLYELDKASDIALQQEQTSLMRLMVEALFEIDENTERGPDKGMGISIDGKRMNAALQVVKDKSYARGSVTGTGQTIKRYV